MKQYQYTFFFQGMKQNQYTFFSHSVEDGRLILFVQGTFFTYLRLINIMLFQRFIKIFITLEEL